MAEEQQKQTTQDPILRVDSLREAEYERTVWVAKIDRALTVDALMKPGYWAHHSAKFRPWDKIEARSDDGTWIAEFIVLDCSRTWAKVHPIAYIKLTTADTSQTLADMQDALTEALKTYEIKHRGPRGWSVIRIQDGSVVHEALTSKDAATAWLMGFAKESRPPSAITPVKQEVS